MVRKREKGGIMGSCPQKNYYNHTPALEKSKYSSVTEQTLAETSQSRGTIRWPVKAAVAFWLLLLVGIWFVEYMQVPPSEQPLKKFVRQITYPSKVYIDKIITRQLSSSATTEKR